MKPNSLNPASIEIIGADANNLKNLDVIFPLKRISVVTGVSGSGKSSLLADTLAAEGSRRMRIFLGMSQEEFEQDDVRAFIGLVPPTILVGQRGFRPSVRTTVGTATGLLSILRRLFALASIPYSERAQESVPSPSPESYSKWITKNYRGPAEIWAAPIRHQRTDGVNAVRRLALHGIDRIVVRSETDPPRLRESGREVHAAEFKGLNPNVAHTIEALVDKLEISGTQHAEKLQKILDQAFLAGNDSIVVTLPEVVDPALAGPFGPRLDSVKHWVHPGDADIYFRPSMHLLSFNAPEHEDSGACPECNGIGIRRRLRESALVAHPDRSMRDGAFAIWTEKNYKYVNIQHETIEGLNGMCGFSPDVPWQKLPASARALVLNGSGSEVVFDRDRSGRKFGTARLFPGFRRIIIDKAAGGTKIAEQLAAYVEVGPCDACGGTRWSFQARALRVGGVGIAEILRMPFSTVESFTAMQGKFASGVPPQMRSLVEAICRHAHSIVAVGLGYLSGDRGMLEISEGESRRTRLARVLDAGEQGLCLLLDEPARGLHESDLLGLAESLERLRGEHTIVLNEHREALWDIADQFIEVGPGAGSAGGETTYAGPRPERERNRPQLREPLSCDDRPKLTIRGASIHNIENIDCEIPLGRLTCITGVSGSGKSSFIRGVLAPALLKSVACEAPDFSVRQGRWRSISGTRSITEVVALDQVMPPANRRSLVVTFTGIFDHIRNIFGRSPSAKLEGLSAIDFGVNSGNGRCTICAGTGEVMNGDLWSVCPSCGGSRYGQAALSVRIDDFNVHELLQTSVQNLGPRAKTFGIPADLIAAICDLGIGYIALGRRIDTLSGGEVQRLRLAMRLSSPSGGSMFFILDEPAVGLHPRDVGCIAAALDRVLENGRNTVVIVEHDLQLIRSADWVVDFGPGSGPDGGKIVFSGSPDDLAKTHTQTGLALAGKLPRRKAASRPIATANQKLAPKQQVMRTTALMRTLISGDAAATALDSSEGTAEPTVVVSEHFWAGRDSWELAGLDCEIPKLLLDVQRPAHNDIFAPLLEIWKRDHDCWLAIQPFLTDMQVWGAELPESIVRTASSHIRKEGLQLVDFKGQPLGKNFNVQEARATGKRLTPSADSQEALRHVLNDALAVGARYVELRDRNGRLRAIASDRLLDMEKGLIAPMVPVPSHFSRLDPRGRCPMCKGSRAVTQISEALIIANKKVAPDNDKFLTPEARAVMKGVCHNELNPFLRRLSREELWGSKTAFQDLDRSKRDLILFGFWARPGAGSFLKSPKEDPAEVASWLRWEGLYRHILSQADRSKNVDWMRQVHESAHSVRCGMCAGTGLQPFANLLKVGEVSFTEWVLLADVKRQLGLLGTVQPQSQRQKSTLARIQHCLEPMAKPETKSPSAAMVKRLVESFTTMPAVELPAAD